MLDTITKIVVLLFCCVGLLYMVGDMKAEWEARQAVKRAAEWEAERKAEHAKREAERKAELARRAVEWEAELSKRIAEEEFADQVAEWERARR